MKTQHVETLEELVFRNRNKLYGAFLLRRDYAKHITLSLLTGLFILCSALSYPVVKSFINPGKFVRPGSKDITYDPMRPPDVTQPVSPPPPVELTIPERLRFITPVVVDQEVESVMVSQTELEGQRNIEILPVDPYLMPVDLTKNIIEQPAPPSEPLTFVEEMPAFPGGEAELFNFLYKNLKYPEEAKLTGISGKVFIQFIVESDGSISNIELLRSIGGGCDEKALHVVRMMPKWIPGKQNGVPVRVLLCLPVRFTLR